jgi:hypothetical protein
MRLIDSRRSQDGRGLVQASNVPKKMRPPTKAVKKSRKSSFEAGAMSISASIAEKRAGPERAGVRAMSGVSRFMAAG